MCSLNDTYYQLQSPVYKKCNHTFLMFTLLLYYLSFTLRQFLLSCVINRLYAVLSFHPIIVGVLFNTFFLCIYSSIFWGGKYQMSRGELGWETLFVCTINWLFWFQKRLAWRKWNDRNMKSRNYLLIDAWMFNLQLHWLSKWWIRVSENTLDQH